MAATAVDLDLELLQGSIRDRLRSALRYAVLAPSTHNTQPWIFRLDDESVEVYADRSRTLAHIDPDQRELTMSVGAALEHLRITLTTHLMEPEIDLLPDPDRPDLMARVVCLDESRPSDLDHLLFDQIRRRHTVRGPMRGGPIPGQVFADMERTVNDRHVGVLFVDEGELRERLAQMVRQGDELLMSEPFFRREHNQWVRASSQAADGVAASRFGVDQGGSIRAIALRDREMVREASSMAIVCSRGDGQADWLAAGMAVSRLTLFAASKGLRCSFFLQPVQMPAYRQELKTAMSAHGYPQIVLRLGYAEEGEPTPRRPLDDVLVERRQSRGAVCWDTVFATQEPKGGLLQ